MLPSVRPLESFEVELGYGTCFDRIAQNSIQHPVQLLVKRFYEKEKKQTQTCFDLLVNTMQIAQMTNNLTVIFKKEI